MITVGVIGCGYWGPNLVRNLVQLGETDARWVCDLDQARLDHLSSLYPALKLTRDHTDVLNDPKVDAVCIATPPQTHAALGIAALAAGKHVFIEKPLATTAKECEQLIAAAEDAGRTLMVGHTFLHNVAMHDLKARVGSGELGDIYYIRTQRLSLGLFQTHVNVVWDLAPHDLSIICNLIGRAPQRVSCTGRDHVTKGIADVASLTLEFSEGVTAFVDVSWLDPNKVRQVTVVGSRKMIVYDDVHPSEKVRIFNKRVEAPPHYDTFGDFQYAYHYGDVVSPHLPNSEPLRLEMQHFAACIREGTKPSTDGYNGLQVVRILEAADRSLARDGAYERIH